MCDNYKNSNSQISSIWLWSLVRCPWDPRSKPWRFRPVEIIHTRLMSTAREWQNTHSKDDISLSSWSHCAWRSNQTHSDPASSSIRFRRVPSSFHPWCLPHGHGAWQHATWERESVTAPRGPFPQRLVCTVTCSASFLMNTNSSGSISEIICFPSPFAVIPVIAISLFLCVNKSLCFFLECIFFLL